MLVGAVFEPDENENLLEVPVDFMRFERWNPPSSQSKRVSSDDLRLFWDVTEGDSLA